MSGMFERVLFATDLSRDSERVFMGLAELKCMGMSHARILYVMDKDEEAESFYDVEARANEALALKRDYLAERGIKVDVAVRAGDPADEILKNSRDWGATLIIMGSTPRGALEGLLVGSTAEEVVLGSYVPVFVERLAEDAGQQSNVDVCRVVMFDKALVPIDFSDSSLAVLRRVSVEMKAAVREIVLAHVAEEGWTQKERAGLAAQAESKLAVLARLLERDGLAVRTLVHEGDAAEEIIRMAVAEGADIVAMSSGGKGGALMGLLAGGTAVQVMHHSHVSVLIFPERLLA